MDEVESRHQLQKSLSLDYKQQKETEMNKKIHLWKESA